MCDFKNLNEGNYYWSRTRADSTVVSNKPLIDHSIQVGKVYIHLVLVFDLD